MQLVPRAASITPQNLIQGNEGGAIKIASYFCREGERWLKKTCLRQQKEETGEQGEYGLHIRLAREMQPVLKDAALDPAVRRKSHLNL